MTALLWGALLGLLGINVDDDDGLSWSGVALFILAFFAMAIAWLWVAGRTGFIAGAVQVIRDFIQLLFAPVASVIGWLGKVL